MDVHPTFPMGLIGMFDHPSSKILGYVMGYIQYAPTENYHNKWVCLKIGYIPNEIAI